MKNAYFLFFCVCLVAAAANVFECHLALAPVLKPFASKNKLEIRSLILELLKIDTTFVNFDLLTSKLDLHTHICISD